MCLRWVFLLVAIFVGRMIYGETLTPVQTVPSSLPWLTGPLIAPPGYVVQKGHFEIEPYLYVTVDTGIYDNHWQSHSSPNFTSVNPQLLVLIGLTEWMDIQMTPSVLYNTTQGKSSVNVGDLPIGLDFQLVAIDKWKWFPGIKLTILETFPTGKYQKLKVDRQGTDQTGEGSFITTPSLVFYKVYHVKGLHYMSMTGSLAYSLSSPVHVRGLNTYGGGQGTCGKVYLGNEFTGILSFEYSFNEHFVFAIDNVYEHQDKSTFSGRKGFSSPGVVASVGNPSSEQISFAPALEYNFSSSLGVIAGVWVTGFGRNATEFRSAAMALDYTY